MKVGFKFIKRLKLQIEKLPLDIVYVGIIALILIGLGETHQNQYYNLKMGKL